MVKSNVIPNQFLDTWACGAHPPTAASSPAVRREAARCTQTCPSLPPQPHVSSSCPPQQAGCLGTGLSHPGCSGPTPQGPGSPAPPAALGLQGVPITAAAATCPRQAKPRAGKIEENRDSSGRSHLKVNPTGSLGAVVLLLLLLFCVFSRQWDERTSQSWRKRGGDEAQRAIVRPCWVLTLWGM